MSVGSTEVTRAEAPAFAGAGAGRSFAVEAAPHPERALQSLYGRYKGLAISAAAAVIMEAPLDGLTASVEKLRCDCREAVRPGCEYPAQLAACSEASAALLGFLRRARQRDVSDAELEQVRTTHLELRREVWRVLPCEYVPCCADEHHIHRS
ncbi:MAG: hypothetical protein ACRDLR_01750 [Gaiellaceae bacterium]